ncbi:MAG: very short patch repair endonuclease [Bacteroidetes bacterium]|nr:very short patch repair endonuclease [Bacteroidota bacterium]HET6244817.1 very short patch repair endonuclease [Bacteroidia bacterium]
MISKDSNSKDIKVPRFKKENGFYTTKDRSQLMSKIKSKGTKPEIAFRKALFSKGIRYRVNENSLPGKPDISIKKYKLAIFIDGEFWHGYNWEEKKKKIKTNKEFWIPKIERNMQRDKQNEDVLRSMGYIVFRFWEKEVHKNQDECIKRILHYLKL